MSVRFSNSRWFPCFDIFVDAGILSSVYVDTLQSNYRNIRLHKRYS